MSKRIMANKQSKVLHKGLFRDSRYDLVLTPYGKGWNTRNPWHGQGHRVYKWWSHLFMPVT